MDETEGKWVFLHNAWLMCLLIYVSFDDCSTKLHNLFEYNAIFLANGALIAEVAQAYICNYNIDNIQEYRLLE